MPGFIDGMNLKRRLISGWAKPRAQNGPATVNLVRRGFTIASGTADIPRNDLGAVGWSLTVPYHVRLGDLFEDRLSVVTGESETLPVFEKLRVRNAQRLATLLKPEDLPFGTRSMNGLVMGREGFAYLEEGANGVARQYDMSTAVAEDLARRWSALIRQRNDLCRRMGRRFLQIILPEKSSLLPEFCPFPSVRGTPLFNIITAEFANEEFFVDGLKLLEGDRREELFWKLNNHLTPLGSLQVVNHVLSKIGLPPVTASFRPAAFRNLHNSEMLTDEGVIEEPYLSPETPLSRIVPVKVAEQDVASLVGYRVEYHSPEAVIDLRVMVFGNSFFGKGSPSNEGHHALELTWWFSRLFRHFHFSWTPEIDQHLIEQFSPDIVIAQTIERFLPVVPPK